jgi:hypothetical protein
MSPAERQRLRDHGADLVAAWPQLAPDEIGRIAELLRPGLIGPGQPSRPVVVLGGDQAGHDAA